MRLEPHRRPVGDARPRKSSSVYEDVADEKQIAVRPSVDDGLTVAGRSRSPAAGRWPTWSTTPIKYTPAGRTGDRQRTCATDAMSCIEVADTGIGIAAHDVPRIWERLYRGDQSRSRARARARPEPRPRHRPRPRRDGGRRTEPGRGSTFIVRLPLVTIGVRLRHWPAFINARGAPRPLALARRLRAALGPQTLLSSSPAHPYTVVMIR